MAISNMKCVMSNGTYKLLEFGSTTKLHRCFLTKNPILKPFLRISMVEPNMLKTAFIANIFFKPFLPYTMSQNSQTNIENLVAFAGRFLKCIWSFWDIMYEKAKNYLWNTKKNCCSQHFEKLLLYAICCQWWVICLPLVNASHHFLSSEAS